MMPGKVRSEPLSYINTFPVNHATDSSDAGQSQFLTSPMPAQPLSFNLSLDDHGYDDENTAQRLEDNDSRLMEMLASQAAHREDESAAGDEDTIPTNKEIPETKKRSILQRLLHMAASNGDLERVRKLLHGAAKDYVDVNAPDEEGTAPIIYASCFVSPWKCTMSGIES